MLGQRTTQVYPLQGEAKFIGNLSAPVYAANGVPMLVASIGQDNTSGNGVTGIPTAVSQVSKQASAGSSTSFSTTGVTSVTLTSIVGTFAVSQVVYIVGSMDAFGGGETCAVSAFSSPTLTVSATTKTHTGTITVTVVGFVDTGALSVGGSTITLVSGGGAYFTTGDVVQIDLNVAGTSTAESHKTSVSTDTLTITDTSPNNTLFFAHLTGIQVIHLGNATTSLPTMSHTVPLAGTISSFTFEKNLGNFQSEQYAGGGVNKYQLKVPTGNNPANFTADLMAQSLAFLTTPTTPVINGADSPYVFREATLSVGGTNFSQANNFALNLDNQMKATYTYSGQAGPSFLPATDLIIGGTHDMVWSSHTDATFGLATLASALTQKTLSIVLAHTSNNFGITLTMPEIVYKTPKTDPKVGELILQTMAFDAFYSLTAANPATIVATIVNNVWTPY